MAFRPVVQWGQAASSTPSAWASAFRTCDSRLAISGCVEAATSALTPVAAEAPLSMFQRAAARLAEALASGATDVATLPATEMARWAARVNSCKASVVDCVSLLRAGSMLRAGEVKLMLLVAAIVVMTESPKF
ncbi:hypothetical protein EYD00_02730 [Agrobacterium sp. 33MFTa1.1]|nr:hypothetical protein DBL06_09840 [Agrobacterium pusense]QBJ12418.1 hypothetical protein EYD00_02730 [Agrobacterium sp. 33MFTa1.1]